MPLITQPPPLAGGALLARLHAINAEYGYLPEEALRTAAKELGVPLSQLYSAASFYAAFSFQPRGRHLIQVCLGTACYVRGGDRLREKLESVLDVQVGETTADRAVTLESAYCFGSCSMSPVIRVDGEPHGRLKAGDLSRLVKKCQDRQDESAAQAAAGEGQEA